MWAFPIGASAKSEMRAVYKDHNRFRGQAKRLAAHIEKQFAVGKIYNQFIDALTKEDKYDLNNWIKNFNQEQIVKHE
jgi:ADP-dependent phosphofructokinase/glucokinase